MFLRFSNNISNCTNLLIESMKEVVLLEGFDLPSCYNFGETVCHLDSNEMSMTCANCSGGVPFPS